MSANGWIQWALYIIVVVVAALPAGKYLARVYRGEALWAQWSLGWLERLLYRCAGVDASVEMDWRRYALAVVALNTVGIVATYAVLRLQAFFPWNPQQLPNVAPDLALDIAISFATNTNWQSYSGESTLSRGSQMLALTVQNFLSAATGMAVAIALIRGFARAEVKTIGNFWYDATRSIVYVLLPLSVVLALILASQGVIQNFAADLKIATLDSRAEQVLPMGPVASQVAIKQLGTNGGGYFNANSAHPFENPTPMTNFLSMVAILLLPAAFCIAFGALLGEAGSIGHGWALLAAMLAIFIPASMGCILAEQCGGSPAVGNLVQAGNLEGKEIRFGVVNSALWATATTAASNGSVNAMHDSFTPLGGAVPMLLIQLGEVVFGGVGSGLYGMLLFAVVAVFVSGLMVGRTPEYLGKKIQAFEMKMASLAILIPPCLVLCGTAVALLGPGLHAVIDGQRQALTANNGPHGFSEVLYAYSSAGNNNGSAFAGLNANVPFYHWTLAIAMFVGRYWLIVAVLAMAGSLAAKRRTPVGPGTLPTNGPAFAGLLVAVVLLVGALTFFPALALGPLVEHLQGTGG